MFMTTLMYGHSLMLHIEAAAEPSAIGYLKCGFPPFSSPPQTGNVTDAALEQHAVGMVW